MHVKYELLLRTHAMPSHPKIRWSYFNFRKREGDCDKEKGNKECEFAKLHSTLAQCLESNFLYSSLVFKYTLWDFIIVP